MGAEPGPHRPAGLLLGPLAFQRQVDVLLKLELEGKAEGWQDAEERFENFVSDAFVLAFQNKAKRQSESLPDLNAVELDVESVESLLRGRVRAFVQQPASARAARGTAFRSPRRSRSSGWTWRCSSSSS